MLVPKINNDAIIESLNKLAEDPNIKFIVPGPNIHMKRNHRGLSGFSVAIRPRVPKFLLQDHPMTVVGFYPIPLGSKMSKDLSVSMLEDSRATVAKAIITMIPVSPDQLPSLSKSNISTTDGTWNWTEGLSTDKCSVELVDGGRLNANYIRGIVVKTELPSVHNDYVNAILDIDADSVTDSSPYKRYQQLLSVHNRRIATAIFNAMSIEFQSTDGLIKPTGYWIHNEIRQVDYRTDHRPAMRITIMYCGMQSFYSGNGACGMLLGLGPRVGYRLLLTSDAGVFKKESINTHWGSCWQHPASLHMFPIGMVRSYTKLDPVDAAATMCELNSVMIPTADASAQTIDHCASQRLHALIMPPPQFTTELKWIKPYTPRLYLPVYRSEIFQPFEDMLNELGCEQFKEIELKTIVTILGPPDISCMNIDELLFWTPKQYEPTIPVRGNSAMIHSTLDYLMAPPSESKLPESLRLAIGDTSFSELVENHDDQNRVLMKREAVEWYRRHEVDG